MSNGNSLTEGRIVPVLLKFAMPVFAALFLQAMYGGVDLLVVGQFGTAADVSGVATGSMLMQLVTMVIAGLVMGVTILVGICIGERNRQEAGDVIGQGLFMFSLLALVLTVILSVFARPLAVLMHAPQEAVGTTADYVRICGLGVFFIIFYNILGGIFRGLGDSKLPLLTVSIACVVNIVGDLLLVAVFHMGTAGAAIATVLAQAISVIISFLIIRRKELPFDFSFSMIHPGRNCLRILRLGAPVALQEALTGTSFLVIQVIVNSMGLVYSAGVGVAEKVCAFLMLMASAFMQSIAAFTAQNNGAGLHDRAQKGLFCAIGFSFISGSVLGYLAFFHGDVLAGIFSSDPEIIAAAHSYLKAYAIDCYLTSFHFCFAGYFNGYGKTLLVMLQGVICAFCLRIPIAYFMSKVPGATLFMIGLGTPIASFMQVIICVTAFLLMRKKLSSRS